MPDYFPFMCVDLVHVQLHVPNISDFVDGFLVLVGEIEHVVCGIPAGSDVMGNHLPLK